jgi:hypothetical protein
VVLWASAFVAIRSAGGHFAPGALALGRLLVASLALGVVWLLSGGGWPTWAAWPGILGSGLLWFGLYMVTLNWSERDVDAGTAAMLVNIGPILLALLGGWLLHEGFPRRLAAGMAVSFGGVLVVGISESDGGRTPVTGVVLCLVAAVCYAAGVVGQKLALRHASAVQVTAFGCFTRHGRMPSVRRPVPFSARFGSGQRHAASRLPGAVPDHFGLHHLGLRARPDHLREDGRHHLRGADARHHHVVAHPGAGPPIARRRRRSYLPRGGRRIAFPLTSRPEGFSPAS